MRIQLIAVGSTGDVRPMCVLGKELARRGHDVCLAAFEALRPMVEEAGLSFYLLPGDANRYIGSIIKPGANPLTYLSRFESSLSDVADGLFTAMYEASAQADAVVTGFFGATMYAIADKLQIPLFQSNYCLTDATGMACLPVMKQPPLGAWFNRATYHLAYQMIGMLEKRYAVPWCQARGIVPRTMDKGPCYQAAGHTVPVLYAFSEAVVPRPIEWTGENFHITGFWEVPSVQHQPSPALQAFLDGGDAPVYVGFGSMTSGDMAEALQAVLYALEHTGRRAVLSAGWGNLPETSVPAHVHVLREYVPHHWLFGQVAAVVHHGGAGTTAAGLMAGKPSLVVPFGSDQYFWGDRVHALDCGPKPLLRKQLNPRRLTASMEALVGCPEYAANAQRVQASLLLENGPARAADLIEETLLKW